MQIKIGNTLFLGGDSKYKLASPVQGLESPAIRVGDGLYAGRDGGFVSGHFYGHRTIILKGFYIGEDCDEADSLRRLLFGYLRIRYLTPIFIEDFSGNIYYTEGYITNVKADITGPVSGDYQITILCPDPLLYKATSMNTESIWEEHDLTYGTSTEIINGGNFQVFPIITLTGAIQHPVIENETTLQTLSLNTTDTANDVLIINNEKRIVLKNNISINADRTTSSSWISLLPETNNIRLTATSQSLTSAKIKYKKGVVGI